MDNILTKIVGYTHEWFGGHFPCPEDYELKAREKVVAPFYEDLMKQIEEEKTQGKWQKRPIVEYVPEPEAPLKWWQKGLTENKIMLAVSSIPVLVFLFIVAIVSEFQ